MTFVAGEWCCAATARSNGILRFDDIGEPLSQRSVETLILLAVRTVRDTSG